MNILSSSLATVLFVGFFGDSGVTLSTVVMTVAILLFGEISPKISHWPTAIRALLYGSAIMTGEYISGSLLTKFDICPWSYKGCKYTINDIVRLDYLPFWMIAGLIFERILDNEKAASHL